MNYHITKLTVKDRCSIDVGALVEIPVNEVVEVPIVKSITTMAYGEFYLRKCLAKRGLLQVVHSPFKQGFIGQPLIVVKNMDVAPIELNSGDEIGELFIWY